MENPMLRHGMAHIFQSPCNQKVKLTVPFDYRFDWKVRELWVFVYGSVGFSWLTCQAAIFVAIPIGERIRLVFITC